MKNSLRNLKRPNGLWIQMNFFSWFLFHSLWRIEYFMMMMIERMDGCNKMFIINSNGILVPLSHSPSQRQSFWFFLSNQQEFFFRNTKWKKSWSIFFYCLHLNKKNTFFETNKKIKVFFAKTHIYPPTHAHSHTHNNIYPSCHSPFFL